MVLTYLKKTHQGGKSLRWEEPSKISLEHTHRRKFKWDWCSWRAFGTISKLTLHLLRAFSNEWVKFDNFRFNKDNGKNCFTKRMIDEWNRLGSHVDGANTIATFKRRLDEFTDRGEVGLVLKEVPCISQLASWRLIIFISYVAGRFTLGGYVLSSGTIRSVCSDDDPHSGVLCKPWCSSMERVWETEASCCRQPAGQEARWLLAIVTSGRDGMVTMGWFVVAGWCIWRRPKYRGVCSI